MNPWELSASELLIWGFVLHLIADWIFQNDWMASNKSLRRERWKNSWRKEYGIKPPTPWWDRHPAAYVHAGIHGILLAMVFGWVAIPLALVHLIIDCRWVVEKWAALIQQTPGKIMVISNPYTPLMDVGAIVRMWVDQVFHIACIVIAALLVTL